MIIHILFGFNLNPERITLLNSLPYHKHEGIWALLPQTCFTDSGGNK